MLKLEASEKNTTFEFLPSAYQIRKKYDNSNGYLQMENGWKRNKNLHLVSLQQQFYHTGHKLIVKVCSMKSSITNHVIAEKKNPETTM